MLEESVFTFERLNLKYREHLEPWLKIWDNKLPCCQKLFLLINWGFRHAIWLIFWLFFILNLDSSSSRKSRNELNILPYPDIFMFLSLLECIPYYIQFAILPHIFLERLLIWLNCQINQLTRYNVFIFQGGFGFLKFLWWNLWLNLTVVKIILKII